MTSGSDMMMLLKSYSAALPRAHDLDAVAGMQRRHRPGRGRHHGAVERHRNAALSGVQRLRGQQGFERGGGKRLVLAVDADFALRPRALPHSAPPDRKGG